MDKTFLLLLDLQRKTFCQNTSLSGLLFFRLSIFSFFFFYLKDNIIRKSIYQKERFNNAVIARRNNMKRLIVMHVYSTFWFLKVLQINDLLIYRYSYLRVVNPLVG